MTLSRNITLEMYLTQQQVAQHTDRTPQRCAAASSSCWFHQYNSREISKAIPHRKKCQIPPSVILQRPGPLMFVPVCLQEETASPKEVNSGVNSVELKIHRTQAVFEAAWVLFFYFKAEKLLSRQALCPASYPSG